MEKYAQARIGGNAVAQTTGAWAVAKFEHDSSRPVDGYAAPQLHTHAVIFNVTEYLRRRPKKIANDARAVLLLVASLAAKEGPLPSRNRPLIRSPIPYIIRSASRPLTPYNRRQWSQPKARRSLNRF
jgi:TrwC relaxase